MKIIIILLICVPSLLAEDNAGDISFKYGFLGQFKSNPDSTVELSDSSIIHTDDEVRINAGYLSRTHFYAVFLSSEGEYMLLYPEDASKEEKSPSDTTYVTALQWNSFIDPAGLETFYLINSEEPQADLEKLFRRYAKAPEKGQAKLGKKIAAILNSLDPDKKEGLANLSKRLDKPLVGGVAFRGEEDEKLKDQSLTHTCSGKNGIAFQKITLIHK
jgi:hypothetical protein